MTPGLEQHDVLIVEDDLALLAFLVTRLEYESDLRVVGYATDAAEAQRMALDVKPDIVLSDFDLPDLDGLTLLGRLRESLPDAALVLYTAVWSASFERAARLNGADDCLDKTVPPSQMIAAMRHALDARRSETVSEPYAV